MKIKTTLVSAAVATLLGGLLIPRTEQSLALLNGCAWGCFVMLLDAYLFVLFAGRQLRQGRMAILRSYVLSALVRLPLVAGLFVFLVFKVKVDGMGMLVGVTGSLIVFNIALFALIFRSPKAGEASTC